MRQPAAGSWVVVAETGRLPLLTPRSIWARRNRLMSAVVSRQSAPRALPRHPGRADTATTELAVRTTPRRAARAPAAPSVTRRRNPAARRKDAQKTLRGDRRELRGSRVPAG